MQMYTMALGLKEKHHVTNKMKQIDKTEGLSESILENSN